MTQAPVRVRNRGLLARWAFVFQTCNPPPGKVDIVSRWLVLSRACVFPMTITSGLVAGLLAVRETGFHAGWFALAAGGLVAAHAANNLMNDLFDLDAALDTKSYPRSLYAPHPVLSGMISRRRLAVAAVVVNLSSLAILVTLAAVRGWPIVAFALGGFFISAGYTMPPVRLKKRGLGEPGVFVVWGPLMVGGTYYAAAGAIPWEIWAASVPYGLLATAVLMGKHIDKMPWDAEAGIGTLPVHIGERAARVATLGLMVGFYVSVAALVAVRALPLPSLLAFVGITRLVPVWKGYRRPKPDEPPKGYPVWPLWFVSLAFVHTRRAGALFVAGLAIGAVLR